MLTTALVEPSLDNLVTVLSAERKALEQLLYRMNMLHLVLRSRQARFVIGAIDELTEAQARLSQHELMRAMVTESLFDSTQEPDGNLVISLDPTHPRLVSLVEDMRRLFDLVEQKRRECRQLAADRGGRISAGSDDLQTSGSGPDGITA